MIIKPHMIEADFTKVFKDGEEITYSCSEVDSKGTYALCIIHDKKGHIVHNNGRIVKKRIKNVQVIIGGELI